MLFRKRSVFCPNQVPTKKHSICHKEQNQHQQHVPKVPPAACRFNKSLKLVRPLTNRNTPPRAALDGVFCVRGDAFKDYDVSSMVVGFMLIVPYIRLQLVKYFQFLVLQIINVFRYKNNLYYLFLLILWKLYYFQSLFLKILLVHVSL